MFSTTPKTLPKDLEWTDLEVSEDYNIGLQLLTRGVDSLCFYSI